MKTKSFEDEIKKNLKEMKGLDSTSEEYQKKLNTVIKLTNMMDKASKIETDSDKTKESVDDNEKIKFNKEEKQSNQKKENLIKILLGKASVAGPIIITIIGVVSNHRLAMRSLNMEYVDNGITPRMYNECRQNIRNFSKK